MMNDRAKEIGAKNTHFVNPNGLPAEGHYTTAYDLALIAAAAMRDPVFCQIVGTKSIVIEPDGKGTRRTLQNKNKLLWQFNGATGVKTGYTKAAGRCLVGAADRDGKRVVAVVLNAPDMWDDITLLMEDSLSNLRFVTLREAGDLIETIDVIGGLKKSVDCVLKSDITACITEQEAARITYRIELPESVDAPVKKGQTMGKIIVCLDEIQLNQGDILAGEDVIESTYFHHLKRLIKIWIGTLP